MNASDDDGYNSDSREHRTVLSTERSTPDSLDHQGPARVSESPLVRRILLAIPVLVLVVGVVLIALNVMRTDTDVQPSHPAVAPGAKGPAFAPPLSPETKLTRIAFGSCLSQRHPQPIWQGVLAVSPRPQMFLMIGDNVYGDVKSPALTKLSEAYQTQARHPEFAEARRAFPFLATWDDHDYGRNDAGADFEWAAGSEKLFRAFWQVDIPMRPDGGIYYAKMYGVEGARVQLVFLDTRTHRSAFQRRDNSPQKSWGRYVPDPDPAKTMLGAAQWQWLSETLKEPADLRVIVSSVQVWSDGHGFERWGNLPIERDKLREVLTATGAKGVVFLSGDRHAGAIYTQTIAKTQIVPEVTSSSLNRSYGPSRDLETPELLTALHNIENFGLIDIDWQARRVTLSLRGRDGRELESITIKFADLGLMVSSAQ